MTPNCIAPVCLAACLMYAVQPASAAASCEAVGEIDYARKSDLPAGAAAATGFEIAEVGTPFQMTDALGLGERLPFHRFVSARQVGCKLHLILEYGGRASGITDVELDDVDDHWVVRHR